MQPPRVTAQKQGYRRYKPQEVKDAERKFIAGLAPHAPTEPLDGPVCPIVKWMWYTKGKRKWGTYTITKPDTDNLQKMFKDTMGKVGFYPDDAAVDSEVVEKFWNDVPGIFVRLEKLK